MNTASSNHCVPAVFFGLEETARGAEAGAEAAFGAEEAGAEGGGAAEEGADAGTGTRSKDESGAEETAGRRGPDFSRITYVPSASSQTIAAPHRHTAARRKNRRTLFLPFFMKPHLDSYTEQTGRSAKSAARLIFPSVFYYTLLSRLMEAENPGMTKLLFPRYPFERIRTGKRLPRAGPGTAAACGQLYYTLA
jgi:hypothetical protein